MLEGGEKRGSRWDRVGPASRTRVAVGLCPSAWSMKGALCFVGAPAREASSGYASGLSLIAWLGGGEKGRKLVVCEGRQGGQTNGRGEKKK